MKYRDVRYTIRTCIEREQWSVAIHPEDVEADVRVISGPRQDAELPARSMIDEWLKKRPAKSLMRLAR